MRKATLHRKTKETDIQITLNVDGSGLYKVKTPVPFLSHMMEAVTKHGLFDMTLLAKGDVDVDTHHTVEDVGLCLGEVLKKALGNKKGIRRFGQGSVPLDETLSDVVIDISGRPYLVYEVPLKKGRIGTFDIELVEDFFQALTTSLGANIHARVIYGRNKHHVVESLFKSLARALDMATQIDPRIKGIPSTKGKL